MGSGTPELDGEVGGDDAWQMKRPSNIKQGGGGGGEQQSWKQQRANAMRMNKRGRGDVANSRAKQ